VRGSRKGGPVFSNDILPGASLALLLANFPGVLAPGIIPWQYAIFLVVIV